MTVRRTVNPMDRYSRMALALVPATWRKGVSPRPRIPAATVLTSLGATHDFKDVHFLSAMNRAQVANQTYESFALAFRYVPSP